MAAARRGTLKAASEDLNLSVSALSRRIKGLESYVGEPLFERLHHEFRPTATGARLRAGMEPLFDQLAVLLDELRDEGRHYLRIGVPSAFATAWLMPRLNGFRARFPSVELHLDSSGSPLSKLGVSLDAIVYFANRNDIPDNVQEFRSQRAFAVAAPGLIDIRGGLQKALRDHPLLVHSELPEILACWLRDVGRTNISTPRIEYFDDGALLVSAAENGLGIALVLEDMVNFYPRRATIVRPFGECAQTPYSYCLGTKMASGSGRALAWFRDWLLVEAEQDARILVRAPEAA